MQSPRGKPRFGTGAFALCAVVVLMSIAAACNRTSGQPGDTAAAFSGDQAAKDGSARVVVSAAASTQDAVAEIARRFTSRTGAAVDINVGSSSALANQILQGAPADVYLSANRQWADAVRQAGLAAKETILLTNKLVLVVPAGNPAGVHSPDDLLSPRVERIAVAGESAPAGIYAERALRSLGLWERIVGQGRIVRGSDVRATLSYVQRGEVQAGVVYATDVRVATNVEAIYAFPADAHEPIEYVLVLLKRAETRRAAAAFFDELQAFAAAEVFRDAGFEPLRTTTSATDHK